MRDKGAVPSGWDTRLRNREWQRPDHQFNRHFGFDFDRASWGSLEYGPGRYFLRFRSGAVLVSNQTLC